MTRYYIASLADCHTLEIVHDETGSMGAWEAAKIAAGWFEGEHGEDVVGKDVTIHGPFPSTQGLTFEIADEDIDR